MPIVSNGAVTRVDQNVPGAGANDDDPAITVLADGGYAVAWVMDGPNSSKRAYARKFDAAGAPVSDQVFVEALNGPIFGPSHILPKIVRTSDGGFQVGFLDHLGAAGYNYRLATFDASGAFVTATTPRTGNETDWFGDLSYNEGGSPHVAVVYQGSGGRDLWVDGSMLVREAFYSELDVVDFGDGYILSYTGVGPNSDVFVKIVRTGFSGTPFSVAADATGSQQGEIANDNLAVGVGGGFAVVWENVGGSGDGVRVRVFDATATATGPTDIIIAGGGNGNAEIIALSNGRYLVTWNGDGGVKGQQIGADGALIGAVQVLVNDVNAVDAAAAQRSDGSIILTYRIGFEIYTQRFDILADPTAGNDTLTGTASAELIDALAGDDSISTLGGNDTIIGGLGRDTLTGGSGADHFRLIASNHSLTATPDVVTDFNSGEDKLDLGPLNLTGAAYVVVQQSSSGSVVQIDADANGSFEQTVLFTGSITGQDIIAGVGVTVVAGAGDQVLIGTGLTDALAAGEGNDQAAGRDGNDSLYGQGGNDILFGQQGDDFAYGGSGSDSLVGDIGNDSLLGEDGDDSVFGQDGNDLLYGGEGSDGVYGGIGNDTALGGAGADTVLGEDGDDILFGEAGVDLLIGGGGVDLLFGGSEADQLLGGAGTDTLVGEAGADTLYGEAGADTVYGGADGDTVFGGTDGDTLYGDGGSDTLSGEEGGDVLVGGTGGDVLVGGAGGDLFLYLATGDSNNAAADLIVDLNTATDVVSLTGIDANLITGGDQAFTVVTTAGVLAIGQLRLTFDSVNNRTILEADNDGIAGADLVILINGNVAAGGWLGL